MDVASLLNEIGQKVEYVNARRAVADEAKQTADADLAKAKSDYEAVVERSSATLDAAMQDLQKAEDELQGLRAKLDEALGGLLQPRNPRVTISQ